MKEYIEMSPEEILFLKNLLSKQLKEHELNETDLEKISGESILPKECKAGLLTAILAFSFLPNQSVGAVKNIGSSSMIRNSSGSNNSNGKKIISLETLKKLKMPIAITGVVGETTLLIGVLTFLVVHKIRNAKTPKEVENVVNHAVENEGGENIPPDKFIALVNATCDDLTGQLKGKVDENILIDFINPFNNLEHEVRERATENDFNVHKFTIKLINVIDAVKPKVQQILQQEEEKKRQTEQQQQEKITTQEDEIRRLKKENQELAYIKQKRALRCRLLKLAKRQLAYAMLKNNGTCLPIDEELTYVQNKFDEINKGINNLPTNMRSKFFTNEKNKHYIGSVKSYINDLKQQLKN